jgi:cell pole-organizing protein PopZ
MAPWTLCMSDNNQDPTMEEILASIRRIISEDEGAPAGPHGGDEPLVLGEDDVLKFTNPEPDPMDSGEALVMSELEPEPPLPSHDSPSPMHAADPAPAHSPDPLETGEALTMSELESAPPAPAAEEPLVSPPAASSVASAFGALERSVQMPPAGRTLEDSVRDMLRPMLKTWLDENLPNIVTSQVAAEVERIARQRR